MAFLGRFILGVLLWSSTSQAISVVDADLSLLPASSSLTYTLIHKFHEVVGKSQEVEGRVVIEKGRARMMFRVPAGSFDSGNTNRDAHVKEILEVHKFPYVVFKGDGDVPKEGPAHIKGTLQFHGVDRSLELVANLEDHQEGAQASFSFSLSLTDYQVERPSLLFIQVEDLVTIVGKFLFAPDKSK